MNFMKMWKLLPDKPSEPVVSSPQKPSEGQLTQRALIIVKGLMFDPGLYQRTEIHGMAKRGELPPWVGEDLINDGNALVKALEAKVNSLRT